MLELILFINYRDGDFDSAILRNEKFAETNLIVLGEQFEAVGEAIRQLYLNSAIGGYVTEVSIELVGVYNEFDREVLESAKFNLKKLSKTIDNGYRVW